MRLLLGIILGFLLTVGVVYVVDHTSPEAAAGAAPTRMVNWDVVSDKMGTAGVRIREGWDRLTGAKTSTPAPTNTSNP